jgi:peptidoglycan/LPS O-acetylase OafA/YrhL
VTFARLRPADWVVFVAALALLFTTAPDWYSTKAGEEARQIERQAQPDEDAPSGQVQTEVQEDAGAFAQNEERNAWQESGTIDRIILIALLATAALGVAAGYWRASGRGALLYGVTGLAASVTALMVLYRILQEPGFDESTTVKIGAPLALGVLGVLAFASATSIRDDSPVAGSEPAYNREP